MGQTRPRFDLTTNPTLPTPICVHKIATNTTNDPQKSFFDQHFWSPQRSFFRIFGLFWDPENPKFFASLAKAKNFGNFFFYFLFDE
jgi:hypothetical protein